MSFTGQQILEASAIFDIKTFQIGSRNYALLNKYCYIEIDLINDDLIPTKLASKTFAYPVTATHWRLHEQQGLVEIYVVQSSGVIECLIFDGKANSGLDAAWEFNSILDFDTATNPLAHFELTSKYLVLSPFKKMVRIFPAVPDFSAFMHEIRFEGVLNCLRVLEADDMLTLVLIIQQEDLEASQIDCYTIGPESCTFRSTLRLPREFGTIIAALMFNSKLLIFCENKALLIGLDKELTVLNRFQVNTKPPQSYSEHKTEFSCLTKAFQDEENEADFFFAATNKGELFHFVHKRGQFIISPLDHEIGPSLTKHSTIFSALAFIPSLKCLMASGENQDGAIFSFELKSKTLTQIFRLSNCAPIIDIASSRSKTGIVMATTGNPSFISGIRRLRQGVKNELLAQSDPSFRGCSKIWCLKKFRTDKEHSYLVASFTKSTSVFKIVAENELEDISDISGIETSLPTLAIANSDISSYWIQVCPDRVVVFRATQSGRLNLVPPTVWRPENMMLSCAFIIRNFVFAYDCFSKRVLVLLITFQIGQGTANVRQAHVLNCPGLNVSTLTAFPLSLDPRDFEFFLAIGCADFVQLSTLRFDTELNPAWNLLQQCPVIKAPVNSLIFWKAKGLLYFAVGYRDGTADLFLNRDNLFQSLRSFVIGKSPVRFSFIKETSGDQTVCCVSRGVWLLKPDSDKLELCAFHPHVDSFTEIVLKPSSKIRTFACIKKESITIISADLGTLSWLETQNVGKNLRKLGISLDGQHVLSSISSLDHRPDEPNSISLLATSELEPLLRTMIPARITTLGFLSKPGYIAMGSVDLNGRGSVHLYSTQILQERLLKRRSSLADTRKQPLASFTYVTASCGFSSAITSVCEFDDGMLMVGCDKEIFILRINYEEGSLNIVRSEPRRYRVHDIVARKTDDGRTLIAVCDELDGIEIVEYDRSLATLIKHLRGDSFSRKASKLCWINDQFLLATDKRGLISVVDIDSPNSNWLETVFDFALHDIPYGCCANPYKENSILVGSMLGAIYVVSLTKGATTQSDGL